METQQTTNNTKSPIVSDQLTSDLGDQPQQTPNSQEQQPQQQQQQQPTRTQLLQLELEKLTKINDAIKQTSLSMKETITNVRRIKNAGVKSNELIDIWSRILSQNKHTMDLLVTSPNQKPRIQQQGDNSNNNNAGEGSGIVWEGASTQNQQLLNKLQELETIKLKYEAMVQEKQQRLLKRQMQNQQQRQTLRGRSRVGGVSRGGVSRGGVSKRR